MNFSVLHSTRSIALVVCVGILAALAPLAASADESPDVTTPTDTQVTDTSLPNPLSQAGKNGIQNEQDLVTFYLSGLIGFMGLLAVVFIIYGGYMFIFSSGKEEMVRKGKDTMLWALVGLALVFLSYTILNFVVSQLPDKAT